ncbi:energy transducer TonB [Olivibacter ginsenosidimutans]|uniref:Energy transducer TonB n=1 Tax=Olivibacter ginsenosidimutans TaxID=1176537 RepID=A0ABP9ADN6_9SPHI
MLGPKLSILSTVWLDLIFDGRNKLYGAYIIRKNAKVDLTKALFLGVLLFLSMILIPAVFQRMDNPSDRMDQLTDPVMLENFRVFPKEEPVLSLPPATSVKSREDKVRLLPPKVVANNQVTDEPPTLDALKKASPGPATITGDPTAPIAIDAVTSDIGEMEAVTEDGGESAIFVGVEIAPSFPGGMKAFLDYVAKNYNYPAAAKEQGISGRIILSFIVEKDGSLTDIDVVRDLGLGTGEEAVRLLQSAPKWKPGIQNGRPVRVRYQLPIALQMQ